MSVRIGVSDSDAFTLGQDPHCPLTKLNPQPRLRPHMSVAQVLVCSTISAQLPGTRLLVYHSCELSRYHFS